MIQVITADVMRESDAVMLQTLENSGELIARAGKAILESRSDWKGRTAILCGRGNNGSDGLELSRLLQDSGADVTVILAEHRFTPDGENCYQKATASGVRPLFWTDEIDFDCYDRIVDCLFGSGFHGSPGSPYDAIIDAINAAHSGGTEVISVDIPSGISGNNGLGTNFVHADQTLSIGTRKTGHFLGNAKDAVGQLINLDIGIPVVGASYGLVTPTDLAHVIPHRPNLCNKGDFGTVALLGGCVHYSGAVKLANLALSALRSGCGIAKLIVPEALRTAVSPYLLESTLVCLPDADGLMAYDPAAIDSALMRVKAVAIGMGWGQSESNFKILRYILENYGIPLVIDADGLNLLARYGIGLLKTTRCPILLTPHLMEFERLSGIPRATVLENPIDYARSFAAEYGITLLLKGPTTIVTDGERVRLVDRGTPGMATAGSGDVLSGVAAGILGYSTADLLDLATAAAWVNGRAGELAEAEVGSVGMIASDTIRKLPMAILEIQKQSDEEKGSIKQ